MSKLNEIKEYLKKLSHVSKIVHGERSQFSSSLEYLKSLGIEFILVGGLASSHYSAPRLTEDVDILVRSENELKRLKEVSVGKVKWIRGHAFLLDEVETEVLTPEFVNLPPEVINYIFDNKVTSGFGLPIPNAEGVIILKSFRLSDTDRQDIFNIIKSKGNKIDFDLVMNLIPEKAKEYLGGTRKSLERVVEDFNGY